jgi:hypothetical protein
VTSVFVTGLGNYEDSSGGDENIPMNDKWNETAFVLILVIGWVESRRKVQLIRANRLN